MSESRSASSEKPPRRPKRQRRPTRRILGLWPRLALLAVLLVVLTVAAVGLVAKISRPYREANRQAGQLDATRRSTEALNRENERLSRRIASLQTREGIAGEARKIGFLRPGEIALVIPGVSSDAALPASLAPAAPSAPAKLSLADRAHGFWQRLRGK